MTIRVAVSGSGNMGQQILQTVAAAEDLAVAGVLEKFSEGNSYPLLGGGSVPLCQSVDGLASLDADVIVDFTNAAWTQELLPAALAAGVRPVIGTTGLDASFLQEMQARSSERRIGGVVASNFALGAVLLMHLARITAPFYDSVEIIEQHHDGKVDAPSGTAMTTAREMRAARDRDFVRKEAERETLPGARGAVLGGVSLHAVRLPGLVAHQTVLFGGLGETLTLRHDSITRESFMPGVLCAIRAVPTLDHLVFGLDRLLGLREKGD